MTTSSPPASPANPAARPSAKPGGKPGAGSRTSHTAQQLDLRRRQRRDLIDRLLERATCLPPADLSLLRAAYHDGRTALELASLAGADPRGMRRRLRRLTDRVLSQEFLFVLRHRESWSAKRRNIATACILHGCSLRQASRDLGLSLYTVRKHYVQVLALYEAAAE